MQCSGPLPSCHFRVGTPWIEAEAADAVYVILRSIRDKNYAMVCRPWREHCLWQAEMRDFRKSAIEPRQYSTNIVFQKPVTDWKRRRAPDIYSSQAGCLWPSIIRHPSKVTPSAISGAANVTIQTFLKDILRPFASQLPAISGMPSWPRSLRVLKRYGFVPNTVFDIGVAYGTFPLYQAFPKAFYHLVDPARESERYMSRLARRLSCQIHAVALGDRDGEIDLEVRQDIQESTVLMEVGDRRIRRVERVSLRRFDTLFAEFARPALCKIDVQGAELMVLRGMSGLLSRIDAVIVEASTIATVHGGAELTDVISFMEAHGFVLADIVGMRRRPLDDALAQLDLMFVPRDAACRADHRWSGDMQVTAAA